MGRRQQQPVSLTEAEIVELHAIVDKGQSPVRTYQRAQALLWSAAGKTDLEIAALLRLRPDTIGKIRHRWVTQHTLQDAPRPGRQKKLDGKQEAFLVALACSDAPGERETWTMQLLADQLVELQVIETPISDETVRRVLKKTNSNRG